ncbi:hypothetical protein BDV18DRAFT_71421 [Aspergillus unguis]
MAKKLAKKSKKRSSPEVAKCQLPVQVSSKIDYHRPLSSPYESPFATLVIGNKEYGLPADFLRKCPQIQQQLFVNPIITMPDIHEDVGHTLVHFLYSGDYETILSPLGESTSDITREYKRSVLTYQASRIYGLTGLEVLAKQKLETLSEEISLLHVLQTTRDVFSRLPQDEAWFPSYIERLLQQSVKHGQLDAVLNELYSTLGQNHHFDNFVMKIMLEILSVRLVSWGGVAEDDDIRFDLSQPAAEESSPAEEPTPVEEPMAVEEAYGCRRAYSFRRSI